MRRPFTLPLVAFVIGCIGFFNVSSHARFASIHTVDVLQLVATGMCFGVALMGVIGLSRSAPGTGRP